MSTVLSAFIVVLGWLAAVNGADAAREVLFQVVLASPEGGLTSSVVNGRGNCCCGGGD